MINLLPALGCVAMMLGAGVLTRRLTGTPLARSLRRLTAFARGHGRNAASQPGA